MRAIVCLVVWVAFSALLTTGCKQNPFQGAGKAPPFGATPGGGAPLAGGAPNGAPSPAQIAQEQQLTAQMQEWQRRAQSLDANNRDLHAQLAQSQQQVQLLRDQSTALQKQLGDTASQLAQIRAAKGDTDKRLEAIQASTLRRGGASITANTSVQQQLPVMDIPGVEVRPEGDVIRVEVPADQLFVQGTAQLHQNAFPILDRVAEAISRNYAQQRIGIEGYTDAAPVVGGLYQNNHQLSAAQATAVFEQLTRRNRLPESQLFILGQGSNLPRASNATPAGRARNRRVEVVIYPEQAGS